MIVHSMHCCCCVHTYIHTHTHTHIAGTHTHTHTHMHTCTGTHAHTHIHTHMHIHTHIHTCTGTYRHMQAHTRRHIQTETPHVVHVDMCLCVLHPFTHCYRPPTLLLHTCSTLRYSCHLLYLYLAWWMSVCSCIVIELVTAWFICCGISVSTQLHSICIQVFSCTFILLPVSLGLHGSGQDGIDLYQIFLEHKLW